MNEYNLQKEDVELIKRLIKTTNSIDTLYKRLYELEINKQTSSCEYQKNLDYLSIALETESDLYLSANLSGSKCIDISDYLLNNEVSHEFLQDNINSMMEQAYDNRVIRRILNVLKNKVIVDPSIMKKRIPPEMIQYMKFLGVYNDHFIASVTRSNAQFIRDFKKDISSLYLSFLQDFINNSECRNLRKALINSKYNVAFINGDVEKDMLNNEFQSVFSYVDSRWVFNDEESEKDFDDLESQRNFLGSKTAINQIQEIITIHDSDYLDVTKRVGSILRQCLIRALFVLMDDESIAEVNYEFHKFIEDKNYIRNYKNDKISESLVVKIFRNINRDKERHNVMTLVKK